MNIFFFENKNFNLDPCFNSCGVNVGFHCFNAYDPNAREKNSEVENSDMYYKIKMMKEDMDQSIKIQKLRKECKELIKSRNQKKSSFPKKWPTDVKGLIKEVKLCASTVNKQKETEREGKLERVKSNIWTKRQ